MLVPSQQQGGVQIAVPQQYSQNRPGAAQHQIQQQAIVAAPVVVAQQQATQPVLPGGVISQPYAVSGGGVQPLALQPMAVPKP